MADVIGKIPEFTSDETTPVEQVAEEVKQPEPERVLEPEKETPAEPPAEEKPVEPQAPELEPVKPVEDPTLKQIQGLEAEKQKLLAEIQSLRGARRELKKEELLVVNKQIDELKDVNPEDVTVIEKVLRSKGYITKEESERMLYDAVKQEEVNKFIEKYPEYKPENDPNDVNWNALQRELQWLKMPSDPHLIQEVLGRAHRSVSSQFKVAQPAPEIKKQQVRVASVGSGGVQRSSPGKTLDPDMAAMLRQGGFSEEDIQKIQAKL